MGGEQVSKAREASLARGLCLAIALLLGSAIVEGSRAATLPAGFVEETLGGSWNEAIGLTFAADGRMFVWERAGRVWRVENGVKAPTPFIDISEEVGGWRDHGLMGFALDPDFVSNGHLYLLYVVDHHHLASFGTPGYDPAANDFLRATIGRLTRYTARAADGFRSVDPASRRVLVGESITNGFPIVFTSHGLGSVVFGEDGTLLVSCGDGGSSSSTDPGSTADTYYAQALAEGIIQPRENIGTFRAQMTSSLAGKILRLDPATGDGVAGNPFFDPAQPRSARSRLWALGLRNPFRMTLRPGTGSHRAGDANPGALFIGDVGWVLWEELNVCARPGMNFGWPIYEGMDLQPIYSVSGVLNPDAPNPLSGAGGCAQPYFAFRDLIKQATLGTVSWANPCDTTQPIPATLDRFVHARPVLDWKQPGGPSRAAVYNGTNAASINVGASGSPVTGSQFGGDCSIGGVWYNGVDFPAQYRNTYFHAEYGALWIKNILFDSNNAPVAVRDFASNAGGVVCLATHPIDGGLYYITWTTTLRRVRYVGSGNQPPVAVASLDHGYGPAPLAVQFTGTNSTDPEGLPLSYQWNFGDGTPINTNPSPAHVFDAPAGVPTRYDVKLRVTDRSGASGTNTLVVSVNNTPPQVTITSPMDGAFYPMTGDTTYTCTALVSDVEHDAGQLSCAWQTVLHHNNHQHPEPVDTRCATTTVISPLGCNGETYFYRVVLTVTDAAGLSTTREARLYPFCTNLVPAISWTNPAAILQGTALSGAQLNATANVPGAFAYDPPAGTVLGPGDNQLLSVTFTPDNRSNYITATAQVSINVVPPFPGARINFQPASAPVPAGYIADTGLAYGARTNRLTFGWDVEGTGNTRDRDSTLSPDQRYDTFIYSQRGSGGTVWEIAVPNDIYTVFLVAGDAGNFDSVYKFSVEGTLALNGTPTTTNRWISGTATMTVADGRLTVSNAPGSINNKLCFIDITRHGPLLSCSPDKSVEFGGAWNFDAPTGTTDSCNGSNVTIAVVSTTTNAAGFAGNTFSVTRAWRATDSCGNESLCSQTVTVVDTAPPSLTCASNKVIRCGTAWDFDAPTAVDLADGTNVTITIAGTLTNSTCAAGFMATRTWRAVDSHGNHAECSQTVSAPPQALLTGRIWNPTNYPSAASSDKPVSGVTLELTGSTNLVAQTASDGAYAVALDAGGDLLLTPGLTNSNPAAGGVTTVDISLLRRHILGITRLDSPYKILAADVNASRSVTTLDISLIRRMVLGITNTFPAGLWRFVPADFVFADPENPWDAPDHRSFTNLSVDVTGQDFAAIKLGDVNNSWTPPVTLSALRPPQPERRAPARRVDRKRIDAGQGLGAPVHGAPPPPTLDAHWGHEPRLDGRARRSARAAFDIPKRRARSDAPYLAVHGKPVRSLELPFARGVLPEVTFQISSHQAQPGDTVEVRVTVMGFQKVTSAQCTLAWDANVLRYAGTGGYGIKGLAAANFGVASVASGRLAFSWDDPEALGVTEADGTTVFSVSFTAIGSAGDVSPLALVDETAEREVGVNFVAATFRAQNGHITISHEQNTLLRGQLRGQSRKAKGSVPESRN